VGGVDGDGEPAAAGVPPPPPAPPPVTILYFDSLGHTGSQHCGRLVKFLNHEWNRHIATDARTTDDAEQSVSGPYFVKQRLKSKRVATEQTEVTVVCKKAPEQENGHDCGIFLLEYAERFLKDTKLRALVMASAVGGEGGPAPSESAEAYLRDRDFEEWFHQSAILAKREKMQEILERLQRLREHEQRPSPKLVGTQQPGAEPLETPLQSEDAAAVADTDDAAAHSVGQEAAAAAVGGGAGAKPRAAVSEAAPSSSDAHPVALESAGPLDVWIGLRGQSDRHKRTIADMEAPGHLQEVLAGWVQQQKAFNPGKIDCVQLVRTHCGDGQGGTALQLQASPRANQLSHGDYLEVRCEEWEERVRVAKEAAAREEKAGRQRPPKRKAASAAEKENDIDGIDGSSSGSTSRRSLSQKSTQSKLKLRVKSPRTSDTQSEPMQSEHRTERTDQPRNTEGEEGDVPALAAGMLIDYEDGIDECWRRGCILGVRNPDRHLFEVQFEDADKPETIMLRPGDADWRRAHITAQQQQQQQQQAGEEEEECARPMPGPGTVTGDGAATAAEFMGQIAEIRSRGPPPLPSPRRPDGRSHGAAARPPSPRQPAPPSKSVGRTYAERTRRRIG
jgi:hypothetical protein